MPSLAPTCGFLPCLCGLFLEASPHLPSVIWGIQARELSSGRVFNSEYITAVPESTVSQRAGGSRRQWWAQQAGLWCWSHHGTAPPGALSPLFLGYRRLQRKWWPSTEVFRSPCHGPWLTMISMVPFSPCGWVSSQPCSPPHHMSAGIWPQPRGSVVSFSYYF